MNDDWARVLAALDVGVVIQDRDFRIAFANPRATELLGIATDEITRRTTDDAQWDVIAPDGTPIAGDGHPGVLALLTGEPVRDVILGVRLPAVEERVWILASAIPERDQAGEVQRVVITFSDVSTAQRALRAQEALYRSVFRSMSEGVVVHDVDGSIRTANAAAERVLGMSIEQMAGREAVDPRWRLIRTDGQPAEPADIPSEIATATGEPSGDRTLGVHRPSGELAWLSVRADPLREPGDDQMRGVVATFTDVTAERVTKLALEASRAQIQRVLDAVPGVVYQHVRPDHGPDSIPIVAGRIREVLGIDPADLRAEPGALFVGASDADRAELARRFDEAVAAGSMLDHEFAVASPGGEQRWLSIHGVPDRTADSVVYTCVITDATASRRMADALRRTQRREAMGEMAAGVAHNFNNMLAVILPAIELVRSESTGSTRQLLEHAERAAHSAADLVRRMLVVGRTDLADPGAVVDLVPLVSEATHICRRTFDRGITIDEDIGLEHAYVRGAATDVQQLLLNLLLNARDALDGRANPTIEVRVAPDGPDVVRLDVRDNGHGMSAETLRRIGEPFFTTKPGGLGTGLGLASVVRTINEAGGTWVVDSSEGVGTTITIRIPVVDPSGSTSTGWTPDHTALEPSTGVVLVIDDEEMVRHILGLQLESVGYEPRLAATGRAALDIVRADAEARRIRAILLDLSMPDLPGAQLLPMLAELAPAVPVIVLSGHVPDASALAGARAILQKPVGRAELADALRIATAAG